MSISDWNFGEKDSVTSCAPTNSPTPIRTLGQPLIFGFETIQTIGICIQSINFFQTFEKIGPLRSYNNFQLHVKTNGKELREYRNIYKNIKLIKQKHTKVIERGGLISGVSI